MESFSLAPLTNIDINSNFVGQHCIALIFPPGILFSPVS